MDVRETRKTALVVDDDGATRRLVRVLLEDLGYVVTEADSAEAAAALLASGDRFDLVATDYRLPGMNGLELLRVAKDRLPGALGVLLSSDLRQVRSDGGIWGTIDAALEKPFTLGAFRAVIGYLRTDAVRGRSPSGKADKSPGSERRRHQRIPLPGCRIELYGSGDPANVGLVLLDATEGGIGLLAVQELARGARYQVVSHILPFVNPIEGEIRVAWCGASRDPGVHRVGATFVPASSAGASEIQRLRSERIDR
jgi:CheY-like chemotaxis protein